MKRLGIIGDPLKHSLSPAMQTAALETMGLVDWTYEALPTPAAELAARITSLRQVAWLGVNVTIPHKRDVLKHLDSLDERAAALGAVNTIVQRTGDLRGYNTDVEGFLADLANLGIDLDHRPTYILGGGGAARAAAFAAASAGSQTYVICRRKEQGRTIQQLIQQTLEVEIVIQPWSPDSFLAIGADSLIINATPVGTWPHSNRTPWPEEVPLPGSSIMYDLVYNPAPTRFVADGLAAGNHATTGLGMLVEQGALAFSLWTGLEAPTSIMRAAAEAALESQHA